MNHINIEASRALAEHLGIPQKADPLAWRQSLFRQLDDMLDRQFELIALLDLMDGDPDLEPYLAGIDGSDGDDREADIDTFEGDDDPDGEDNGDDEPSICGTYSDQYGPDLELDDSDREPIFGWPEDIAAVMDDGQWYAQDGEEDEPHDAEPDCGADTDDPSVDCRRAHLWRDGQPTW